MEKPALVLVVEDEDLVSAILEDTLTDAGFAVLACGDGRQAMAELERDAARFQILLTDVRLPEFDGWSVAHRARELASTIGVIYVTGDSAAEWASKGVPNSVLIQKPFASAQITTAVATLLNKTDLF